MKKLLILFILFTNNVFSQPKFFNKNGKIPDVIGEETRLTFNYKGKSIRLASKEDRIDKSAGILALASSLIPGLLDLGFKIGTDIIDKKLKEYTSEVSVKNTFFQDQADIYISQFEVNRRVLLKAKGTEGVIKSPALKIDVGVLNLPGDSTFVFYINDLKTTLSGAKTKKGYNYNDYVIEIKVVYFDGKERKEQNSSPISVQLIEIGAKSFETFDSEGSPLYVSDKFPINRKYTISEVSVKIVETNSAKVKAQKIKDGYDKYSEDAKGLAKTTINYFIGDTKEESKEEEKKTK